MVELVERYQEAMILLYLLSLLYINLTYIFSYRQVQTELKELDKDELLIRIESIEVVLFSLVFAFFRSWLFYILVYQVTKNSWIIPMLAIFIILDAYHAIFITSPRQLYQSRILILRTVIDSIWILTFILVFYLGDLVFA